MYNVHILFLKKKMMNMTYCIDFKMMCVLFSFLPQTYVILVVEIYLLNLSSIINDKSLKYGMYGLKIFFDIYI